RYILSQIGDGSTYPNLTVAIDAVGIGSTVSALLEEQGINVQRILWGRPVHGKKNKERFINQRAYANILARDAIRAGRLSLRGSRKLIEQACRIPYFFTDRGQIQMVKKDIMRQKMNIKSPDIWDTICFAMMADYIPHGEYVPTEVQEQRDDVSKWING
ncbi:MAG: terminase, partial [Plesiomonas shigelloides]